MNILMCIIVRMYFTVKICGIATDIRTESSVFEICRADESR